MRLRHRRLAIVIALLALVPGLGACAGSGVTGANATGPSGNASQSPYRGPVESATATGPDRGLPLSIRMVSVVSGPTDMTATFTFWHRVTPDYLSSSWCGTIGIEFKSVAVQSSLIRGQVGYPPVVPSNDEITYPSPQRIRMTLPLTALGSKFNPAAPWNAYSTIHCPPSAVREDHLPAATPSPHPA